MPDSVRKHLVALRKAGNAAPNSSGTKRQEYWENSARDMGFVDTDGGIRFVPPAVEPSSASSEATLDEITAVEEDDIPHATDIADEVQASRGLITTPLQNRSNVVSPFEPIMSLPGSIDYEHFVKGSSLVALDDRDLVPDHIFLALTQLAPCQVIQDDRIGTYRDRPVGFVGMCCCHCQGYQKYGPGHGRFFPNSARSLTQTTTAQTIVKHLTTKCEHVPQRIRVRFVVIIRCRQKRVLLWLSSLTNYSLLIFVINESILGCDFFSDAGSPR